MHCLEGNEMGKLVCLQIHNDYIIPGGETKTAKAICDLLEEYGIEVIQYYKDNQELENNGMLGKLWSGINSIYNYRVKKEIESIISNRHIDFALIHNVMPLISNSVYDVLVENNIPIIKYIQNYNLVCLNGALDHGEECIKCKKNPIVGVKNCCYKDSLIYSLVKYISKNNLSKHYVDKIDAFMPNSRFVLNQHKLFGMDTSNMHVMYNYVDCHMKNNLSENFKNYYLYFGRLSKEKGIITTIEAFKSLPNVRLIIMGSGELEGFINSSIKSYDNIEYIGSRTGNELGDVVSNSKCVIVPSEWDEPLPRTILEAYSFGVPIIGADRGGIPEMIDEGNTGYSFEAGKVTSLVNVIKRFERLSIEEYIEIRKKVYKYTKENYSKDCYLKRFKDCIQLIIQK